MKIEKGDIVLIDGRFKIVTHVTSDAIVVETNHEYENSYYELDRYQIKKPTLEEKVDYLLRKSLNYES